MLRALASAVAAALLAACGEPLLYAEIDVPSVAVTQTQAIPGSPQVDAPGTPLPPGGFDLQLGDIKLGSESEKSKVTLNGAAVRILQPGGQTTFALVRQATLQVLPPQGQTGAPVTIAGYDASRDGAATDRLVLRPSGEVDLLPFLAQQSVRIQVVVAGTPPGPVGSNFDVDLTVDLHVLARVEVK